MFKLNKKPVLITAGLAVVCLVPLLLSNVEMWDAAHAEMAILRHDFSMIERMASKNGWYWAYYSYILFDYLAQLTGIPYKVFSNVLTVVSVLGIAKETYWFAHNRFGLEREYAFIGAWAVLAFPIWHILVSTAVFVNIICFWVFMVGLRYWYSNKMVSLVCIGFSLQLFSLFSFAIGFAACEFLLTVSRGSFLRKGGQVFAVSLVLLLGFIGLTSLINVHGSTGTYNTITLDSLQYFSLFFIYAVVFIGLAFLLKTTIADPEEAQRFFRQMLAIVALFFFAVLPYLAVGRPLRYFAFGSFTARHTMLTCIPIALFLAVLVKYVARKFGEKIAMYVSAFVLVALVVLLHQGFSHKVAALVFKDMVTQTFQQTEAPPSGYVAIEAKGFTPPRHVHNYAINLCLYKAYGKGAWMANGYWRRGMDLGPESLKELYAETNRDMCVDVTGDSYTKYVLTLDGYHQEGRFWYWWYYLTSDYSAFKPRLEKVASIQGSGS
jgi:hypothetical protein